MTLGKYLDEQTLLFLHCHLLTADAHGDCIHVPSYPQYLPVFHIVESFLNIDDDIWMICEQSLLCTVIISPVTVTATANTFHNIHDIFKFFILR